MAERISVIGLGKLGLCLAACFSEKGFITIGIDINEKIVESINQKITPISEPGLDVLITRHGGKGLRASLDFREAIESTDITFVLVATPSRPDGSFSNEQVEAALINLAQAFKNSSKPYHLFVISSTVMPGSTNERFIPILEKYSGRKLHADFDVCFDPDFVALGKVIKDFLNPDLVIIGETSQEAGQRVEAIHRQMCENKPQIAHMSIINAEIAKVCLNAYVTLKISFANSLANLCEMIPGADVDSITQAIGADKRISPHYFRGGLGFGGTCFPRDTKAFISLAERYGSPPDLVQATVRVNRYQDRHLSEIVIREASRINDGRIGVLGLAFTLNTPVISESPSVKLIHELIKVGKHVVVFDPLALDNASAVFGDAIKYASSVEECLEKTEIWIVTNRLQDYKLAIESHKPGRSIVVIDCWRNIEPSRLDKEIEYIPFGRNIGAIH